MAKKHSQEFLTDCRELSLDPDLVHEARKLPDDSAAKWEIAVEVVQIDEDTFDIVPVAKPRR